MAWYRAGGGGIPSSLKTDMNDVLNKKFGTSQDYPPADWAPTVNLMGPLPEKTASGAIVTFPDGADGVPLKKCEITLPASLDGYSSVDVKHTGKNFLEIKNKAAGGLTGAVNSDGEYVISGIATSTVYFDFYGGTANGITLDAGKYTFSIDGLQTGVTATWTRNGAWAGSISSSTTINLTAQAMISGYIVVANGTDLSTPITLKCMLEKGDTASTFEPYSGTTHTASLGRTIYGGSVDVVAGSGESLYAKLSLAVADMNNSETYPGWSNSGVRAIVGAGVNKAITDGTTTVGQWYSINTNGNNDIIFLPPARYNNMSQTDWKTQYPDLIIEILVEIPTPEPFTFDPVPIDSKLGNNTIWSEQGDTEVTYRADINLALGGQ